MGKQTFQSSLDNFVKKQQINKPIKKDKQETEPTNKTPEVKKQKQIAQKKENEENINTNTDNKPWLQFKIPEQKVSLDNLKSTDLLPAEFYHQDVVTLAKELLGKNIVRVTEKGEVMKAKIVETEAYKAPLDKACHAYNNKKTDRTSSFWLEGGHCYMYSIYGANYCFNVVAAQKDEPEAVLVRATEPVQGEDIMRKYRGNLKSKRPKDFSGGPGKLTSCMDIDVKRFNAVDLRNKKSGLYIEKGDDRKFTMKTSARININYAKEWCDAPWRFFIQDNKYVSV